MANPWCTGPVDVWCNPGTAGAVFLGHGERGPRVRIRRGWEPIFNDLSGTQIPFDLLAEGAEGFVTIDLTRWNENIYQLIASVPIPGAAPGTNFPGDIGTLMMTESKGYTLWLRFPYASKATFNQAISGPMPAGMRFVQSWLEGPDEFEIGTQANKKILVFRCLRAFNPANGAFTLFDYDMSAIGSLN